MKGYPTVDRKLYFEGLNRYFPFGVPYYSFSLFSFNITFAPLLKAVPILSPDFSLVRADGGPSTVRSDHRWRPLPMLPFLPVMRTFSGHVSLSLAVGSTCQQMLVY